eukprot:COSAG01_NODE_12600_length_1712_cov_14.736516_1_plen_542_part_10
MEYDPWEMTQIGNFPFLILYPYYTDKQISCAGNSQTTAVRTVCADVLHGAWLCLRKLTHGMGSSSRSGSPIAGRGSRRQLPLPTSTASIEGARAPPMLPLRFRASRTRGGEACMHTRSARRFDGAAVERGATAGARTAVLLAVVVTLACGSVSPQRPLRLQGAPTPPLPGYSRAPQWRQLSEAPATQHRDSVDCRRLRHRQCCTAQGARIGAAGITPEYARPGRVNGVANLPCAQALHQLLYGLHCTADGAYWSTNSTNGSLTVCTDLCQRIEDTCGDVTGFTPTDVRRHGGQGSTSALNSSSYCLNLAARVGGSWGGGWVDVASTCSGLGLVGDFESCGSAASSAAAVACVPRRACARPCLGGSVQDMAEREAEVLSQGWAAHERGQCAAWMVENEQDPVHCGVFNIHAWQTHYTREGWARFRSRQACEAHYKAYHCAACEGGALGLRDVWEEWRCGGGAAAKKKHDRSVVGGTSQIQERSCVPRASCPAPAPAIVAGCTNGTVRMDQVYSAQLVAAGLAACSGADPLCLVPVYGNYNPLA